METINKQIAALIHVEKATNRPQKELIRLKYCAPELCRAKKECWGYLDRIMLKLPLLTKQAILSSRQPEAILSIASRRELA
jgi:hypothetical protein